MLPKFPKNKKDVSWKNILKSILFWFLLLTLLGFLSVTNIKIMLRRQKLSELTQNLKKEIAVLEKKNEDLKAKIPQLETKEYLEKVAREQFNLKAPGEKVAVIAKNNRKIEENDSSFEDKRQKNIWRNLWEKFKVFFNSFFASVV